MLETKIHTHVKPQVQLQFCVQVVLVLRQGYVPEKRRANQSAQIKHKQCISWELGD